jgi:hypothetical protein
MTSPPPKEGWWFSTGTLFGVALAANKRVPTPDKAGIESEQALVAIVFSAVALEAFINEVTELSGQFSELMGHDVMTDLHAILEEVEANRGSTRLKFLWAKKILSGTTYDKGSRPFSDFALLITLRDTLVHRKRDDRFTGSGTLDQPLTPVATKIVTQLEQRGLLTPIQSMTSNSWIARISNPTASNWACNTARAMVKSIIDEFPGDTKPLMSGIFESAFEMQGPGPHQSNEKG